MTVSRTASLVTGAAFLVLGAVVGSLSVHLSLLKSRLALDAAGFSGLLLLLSCGVLCGMVVAPQVIRRLGSGRTACLAAFPFAVTLVLVGDVTNQGAAAFALVAVGFVMGVFETAINTQGTVIEAQTGRRVMSRLHAVYAGGGLVGALTAGVLIGVMTAIGNTLLLAAALIASGFALFRFSIADSLSSGTICAKRTAPLPPRVILLGSAAFMVLFCFGAMRDWSAVYLSEALMMPLATAGLGFAAFSAATAIVRLGGDVIQTRIRLPLLLLCGGSLGAIAIVVGLAFSDPVGMFVAMAVLGGAHAILFPAILSATARFDNANAGRNVATVMAIGFSGFIAGPIILGWIASTAGLTAAMLALPVASLTICLAVPFLSHPRART